MPFSVAAPMFSETPVASFSCAVASASAMLSAWKFAPEPSSTSKTAPAATFRLASAVNDAPVTSFTVPFVTMTEPCVAETALEQTNV